MARPRTPRSGWRSACLLVCSAIFFVAAGCNRSPRKAEARSSESDKGARGAVRSDPRPATVAPPQASAPAPTAPLADGQVCLSLRVLARLALAEPARPEVQNLAGLGRLEGYIVDREGGDVILVGQRQAGSPALQLDDLVANLRSIWDEPREHPYCSLDPRKEDTLRYQQYVAQRPRQKQVDDEAEFARLKQLSGPQMVVVGGVPKNSRHAHVMIDADYHMKKVGQGHLAVEGLPSTLDLAEQLFRDGVRSGRPVATAPAMSRFWFHVGPGDPVFRSSEGIVWLESCAVVLLTEREAATASGELYDSGQEDPLARTFAAAFSKGFAEFSALVPIYADLANLYRLQAVLRALQREDLGGIVAPELDALRQRYQYRAETPMPPSLPGLVNRRKSVERRPTGGGEEIFTGIALVMGGVSMEMKTDRVTADQGGRLARVRTVALRARPGADSLAWMLGDAPTFTKTGRSEVRTPADPGDAGFAKLYADAMAGRLEPAKFAPRKAGAFAVDAPIPASYTVQSTFRVSDEAKMKSIMKIQPNDAEGRNREQVERAVETAKFLAQLDFELPRQLPMRVEDGGEVLVTKEVVVSRESVAPGEELEALARKRQTADEQARGEPVRLLPREERLYIETNLDLALGGKGLPDAIAPKPSVTTTSAMREALSRRADNSRKHFEVFAEMPGYRARGVEALSLGQRFADATRAFIERFWRGSEPLQHIGFVHDAILRNYFLDGDRMTIINVGSDYVGSIGNVFSTMMTQLHPPGQGYAGYKTRIGKLFESYEVKYGRPLRDAERDEIARHLALQPYKMLSSDSGLLLRQLEEACGLPADAGEAKLLEAMRRPENAKKIEDFLQAPAVQKKYDRLMEHIEFGLKYFEERLPASRTEDKRILNDFIDRVREARDAKLRVVLLPLPPGFPLASAR